MRTHKGDGFAGSDLLDLRHARSALLLSLLSVVWTVVAGSLAITFGIRSHAGVLVAFGAMGFVDAVGSLALVYHFLHALRHERLSVSLETISHRAVLVGLFTVGCAAVLGGLLRLRVGDADDSSSAGVALAAASALALLALSTRKLQVGRRVSSKALLADGHLSAVGAAQAAVALAGTGFARWLGWHWADATATVLVGGVAIAVVAFTWRAEDAERANQSRGLSSTSVALVALAIVALLDTLLGPRLILVGLLVIGPVLSAFECRLRPAVAVSAIAIGLSVVLGAPDQIWLTAEHAIWVGAIAIVGIANTAVIALAAPAVRRQAMAA
jgi:hypothetical protein